MTQKFPILTFLQILRGWSSQGGDGKEWSTHRRYEKCIQNFNWKTWREEATQKTQVQIRG